MKKKRISEKKKERKQKVKLSLSPIKGSRIKSKKKKKSKDELINLNQEPELENIIENIEKSQTIQPISQSIQSSQPRFTPQSGESPSLEPEVRELPAQTLETEMQNIPGQTNQTTENQEQESTQPDYISTNYASVKDYESVQTITAPIVTPNPGQLLSNPPPQNIHPLIQSKHNPWEFQKASTSWEKELPTLKDNITKYKSSLTTKRRRD